MRSTTIGEKIRIQRVIKAYSQEYTAFQLEISQPAYSKIQRNESEVTVQRIFEIAEILEISPFSLMPKPKYGSGINFKPIVDLPIQWKSQIIRPADQRRLRIFKIERNLITYNFRYGT